jgi:hypothetical protein
MVNATWMAQHAKAIFVNLSSGFNEVRNSRKERWLLRSLRFCAHSISRGPSDEDLKVFPNVGWVYNVQLSEKL